MQVTAQQPRRVLDGAAVHYERRRPEQTTLYRLVQQHAASFIAHTEASTGADLLQLVKDEFDAFLECGIQAHGFLRLRCGDCGHNKLVAFSCKRRGFCPSCGARRMAQTAAHLVDHVMPHVPVRQWALLSLPISLRPRLRVAHWVRERHLQMRDGYVHSVDAAGTLIVLCLRAKNMYDTHLNGWNRQHYQAGGEVELSKHWRLEPQLARQEHSRSAAGNADTVGLVLKYCH